MMPLLFSLGQHAGLVAVQAQLRAGERLFAFLDDVYVATPNPDRVGRIHAILNAELYRHSGIRINRGKPKCGTQRVCVQKVVTFSKDWRKKQTPQPECGEVRICQERDPFGQ